MGEGDLKFSIESAT